MESKDELKEIDIKKRTCYYFDDIMRVTDIDFDNILSDEKSYKTYFIGRNCCGKKKLREENVARKILQLS